MKNAGNACFIAVCFFVCMLPFAGMLLQKADMDSENRELAEFPKLQEDEEWNRDFLQDLGLYFREHFTFRQVFTAADAHIQSRIFKTSNVDTVTVGDDGWLYYTATVDDYLGRSSLSERDIYNIAHNLSMVQEYVQKEGAVFLFTAAPNKNSLYGEHMPYYLQKKASGIRNMDRLNIKLRAYGIAYADLFALFENQEETLYLKRDSHWNQKGAVLVYNGLLDQLGISHDNYEMVKALRLKDAYGDLGNMLYPLGAEPEWEYHYQKDTAFTYRTDTQSTQDAWIETEKEDGTGSLLMFRDSFGGSLLPLLADVFAKSYFSRGVPQDVAGYMEMCEPDVVILEKVERNLVELESAPPILWLNRPDIGQETEIEHVASNTTLEIKECENNIAYWVISGVLDHSLCKEDSQVYVRVADGTNADTGADTYEAFLVADGESAYGYQVYLPKEMVLNSAAGVEVLVKNRDSVQSVQASYFHLDDAAGD